GCAARNQNPCPRLQYDRFSGGNPLLKPEKADSINVGFVFEPTKSLSIGADYFIINKDEEIGLVPTQYVLSNTPYAPGKLTPFQGSLGVERDAAGTVVKILTGQANLGKREIRGFDFNTQFRTRVAGTRLVFGADTTYYDKYKQSDLPGAPLYGRLGLINLPRYKAVFTADAEMGDTTARLTLNHLGPMFDKSRESADKPVTDADREIGTFTTVDLSASYKGFKSFVLAGGIKNLLDREPPFANNDSRTLGFAQVHDIRGRFFYGNVTYRY
ncbi:TonB-dependent receptor domain-containing protein, partial [Chitinimonas sp.]|uniref:TonB-dependent receptor domain-containing protein n=1 Tax=Chitinimonas sp. TaxID=1934313 RepID=UPI0035B32A93